MSDEPAIVDAPAGRWPWSVPDDDTLTDFEWWWAWFSDRLRVRTPAGPPLDLEGLSTAALLGLYWACCDIADGPAARPS